LRWWDQFKRRRTGLPVAKTSQITDKLFVGGQYKAHLIPKLQLLGITAIVNMRTKSVHLGKAIPGIEYLHLPTADRHAPSLENLKKGSEFIQQQIAKGGVVYIHCKAGEGRGPSMAIAYLISTGLTLEDAFETVRKVRRFIRPTKVQLSQLQKFYETYSRV